jgi:hypothetical protein
MKNWQQWPWKQWGKKYLFYWVLWLAFDILFQVMGERKPWSDIMIGAPVKALMFFVIFDVFGKPESVRSTKDNIVAADSHEKTFSSDGNTTIQ